MASSVNALLSIGCGALFGSQAALQTTGNNIANVNTPGYSRQIVRFESYSSLDYRPGQMGQGVLAAEVMRYFDEFIERAYLNKNSEQSRWLTMADNMRSLEAIFNESYGLGINKHLSNFFGSWEKLSQFPSDMAARENLIGKSQTLAESIKTASYNLSNIEERIDILVAQQVEQANELISTIARLNNEINTHFELGKNNPNSLLDKRDQLIRELSALIDVDIINKGGGNVIVNTKTGYTLVDGGNSFSLALINNFSYHTKTGNTTFDGRIISSGADGYEYTFEFVQAGTLGNADAQFKVSLDGGRTWVHDDHGNLLTFTAYDSSQPVKIKDLEIYFDYGSNNDFVVGDRFTVVPKTALFYIQPTIGPLNITPQQFSDGTDNNLRASGGAIAGNLYFRDYQLGPIRDQLEDFTKNLIWEVNRIHSQGAGLEKLTYLLGTYSVNDPSFPLGSTYSGLPWNNRLEAGNFSIALYDPLTGEPIMVEPGMSTAISINFDPSTDSLQDVINNINSTTIDWTDSFGVTNYGVPLSNFLNLSIVDNKLQISSSGGYGFGFTDDTTGILAGLGINTFFKGDSAGNIAVRDDIMQNHNLVNAGRINGAAELNSGDSIIALDIGRLLDKVVSFKDWTGHNNNQTLGNFYGTLVATVGSYSANAQFNYSAAATVAKELEDRQSEVAGVSLDEEMAALIKYQASYKAAAKLITTADQMFQTLLGLKQ